MAKTIDIRPEQQVRNLLLDHGYREGETRTFGETRVTIYVGKKGPIFIQSFPDRMGWEVFAPVCQSNSVPRTLEALTDLIGEEEPIPEPLQRFIADKLAAKSG